MMNFDVETDRCYDCDGKLRHFEGCAFYVAEPVLSLVDRISVQVMLNSMDSSNPPF